MNDLERKEKLQKAIVVAKQYFKRIEFVNTHLEKRRERLLKALDECNLESDGVLEIFKSLDDILNTGILMDPEVFHKIKDFRKFFDAGIA